jgi:hypothetical protein
MVTIALRLRIQSNVADSPVSCVTVVRVNDVVATIR